MTKATLLGLVALTSNLSICGHAAAATVRGEIAVTVVGPFGKAYRHASLSLVDAHGAVTKPNSDGNTFSMVPYGTYVLKAIGESAVASRSIILNVPRLWVKIGVPVRFGDRETPGGYLTIRGRIEPAPRANGHWWARVQGVFLEDRREISVSPDGRFTAEGLDMGTYLVQIYDGTQLRGQSIVEIDSNTSPVQINVRQEGEKRN